MSTVKTINLQHPSSTPVNIVLGSDGSVTGGLPSPNRNLLYNGAMQVHQRIAVATAANFVSGYAGYLTADRWYSEVPYLQGYGTIAQSIENDAPTGSGFSKSLKHLYTGADTIGSGKYMWVSQLLEGFDVQRIGKGTASAKTLTLSFWVKSNRTGTYVAEIQDVDNTRYVSASYTVSSSGVWEYKTITFPADSTGVLDNDNNASLRLNFWLRAGSNFSGGASLQTSWGTATNTRAVGQVDLAATANNYWQVTGVQLEIGSVPTAFEFKSYGQELRECQRYYYRINNTNVFTRFALADAVSTTDIQPYVNLPVTMRVTPTAIDTSGTASHYAAYSAGTTTALNALPTLLAPATPSTAFLTAAVASGLTAGRVAQLIANNTTSAYIGISAEL